VGDYVSMYDIFALTEGTAMNKGVPLMFDFGDSGESLTGERLPAQAAASTRPQPKCRTIGNPKFGLCLEGYVQDLNVDSDTVILQSDYMRIYPNPGIYVASFQGCCRPNNLINNPDSPWKLSTSVVLSTSLPNESPSAALIPVVTAVMGVPTSFLLAAYQAENHILAYRLGTAEEHNPVDFTGGGPPEGMTINEASGEVMLPAKFEAGVHSCVILVTAYSLTSVVNRQVLGLLALLVQKYKY
jgi:hypothetical protein